MAQSPYKTNNPEELRNLASAADTYLQGQLTAAVAADQRALVFAGFLAAAAATIGSAATSAVTDANADRLAAKLSLWTAGGLLAAMLLAILAARPARWFFPGSQPKDWQDDFASQKPELTRLQELLADYDNRIDNNHATMRRNGRLIMLSAATSILTLALGGLALARHF